MRIQFDPNQQYQLDAVKAVTDLFDGQPKAAGATLLSTAGGTGTLLSELGVGNGLTIDPETVLANLIAIQERNVITPSTSVDGFNFTVEMETGTGKTYVYLRSIYQLHAEYGFSKFIIVVPSVAIREGVLKNLQITHEHFAAIFGNPPVEAWVYSSTQTTRLRDFSGSNALNILVINIDAFNKPSNNVIHVQSDKLNGHKPIDFIQATRPIVIVDEPQNMESPQAKAAIASLNPLCTLRYSATHRNLYNLVYRLDPVKAYDLKLVKRIEVDSVFDEADFNKPYIRVEAVSATTTRVSARLTVDVQQANGPKRKAVTVSQNTRGVWRNRDLYEVTGHRSAYEGYQVDGIDVTAQTVTFSNGVVIEKGRAHAANTDDILRAQIRQTILKHLGKELSMSSRPLGDRLKVLSLFFIDRVGNYAGEPTAESPRGGIIRRVFDEEYNKAISVSPYTSLGAADPVRARSAYFAAAPNGQPKDTSGETAADDQAYELIMRHKERLLDPAEPIRFIFSHSALREGWDNPNVFQICTLNETRSEVKKRQEIGRGLRLAVNEVGVRVSDPNVNRLTVIANETYRDFAASLQKEIETDCGVSFEDRIQNARQRRRLNLKKGWQLDDAFVQLWNRIKQKTRYSVQYASEDLISAASGKLKAMPPVDAPRIRAITTELTFEDSGVGEGKLQSVTDEALTSAPPPVPDLIGYLQRETELTRHTLAKILIDSDRIADAKKNPQQFLDRAVKAIRHALDEVIVTGIKYEEIAGSVYEMMLFESAELETYVNRTVDVKNSIYDAIECESKIEREFAKALDDRADIKLFIKLPGWFTVTTPVGRYNPDWAIVKQPEGEPQRLYLVRETKSSPVDPKKLRDTEYMKVECGRRHFQALGVEFKTAKTAAEV